MTRTKMAQYVKFGDKLVFAGVVVEAYDCYVDFDTGSACFSGKFVSAAVPSAQPYGVYSFKLPMQTVLQVED